jgi:hypothetical protein
MGAATRPEASEAKKSYWERDHPWKSRKGWSPPNL